MSKLLSPSRTYPEEGHAMWRPSGAPPPPPNPLPPSVFWQSHNVHRCNQYDIYICIGALTDQPRCNWAVLRPQGQGKGT
eukprot:13820-Pyramimonas_sp.AAC.2